MNIPEKIGWRRILLPGHVKFMLDVVRLDPNEPQPDKVERFIMKLEHFTPGALLFKANDIGMKLLLHAYWAIVPKRLEVIKTREPFIVESLPWFRRNKIYSQYITRSRVGKKRIQIQSYRTDSYKQKKYLYSWKRAYHLTLQYREEIRQEELQHRFSDILKNRRCQKSDS